jgi:hypothetical protein
MHVIIRDIKGDKINMYLEKIYKIINSTSIHIDKKWNDKIMKFFETP